MKKIRVLKQLRLAERRSENATAEKLDELEAEEAAILDNTAGTLLDTVVDSSGLEISEVPYGTIENQIPEWEQLVGDPLADLFPADSSSQPGTEL